MKMNVEYEISEQDFINGQRLAIKNSPARLVRWTRLVIPLFGVALLVFLVNALKQQGFSLAHNPSGGCRFGVRLPTHS